jgi:outer membrane lipase/esterase
MRRFDFKAAVLAIAALGMPGAAGAARLDQFIGFGDSTMDSGYFRYNPTGGAPSLPNSFPSNTIDALIRLTVAAGGSGAFAGPASVDTQLIAARFGLTAMPFIVTGGGGTNYANGSAQTVTTTAADGYEHGLFNNVPIVTQMSDYLVSVHNVANPNALYMISYGGNDLIWLQLQGGSVSPLPYITSLANALTVSIANLQAAGARTIAVLNVYANAKLVDADGTLTQANAVIVNQAATYSAQVWSGLKAAGVNIIPVDVEDALTYASRNPTKFGFTPATVLASSPACLAPAALLCAPAQLVTPNAEQTYLWSDANHLTTAGQTIESDLMYSLITAPSEVSVLAESAVQVGLARMAAIQAQIDLSGRHRGPAGVNVWFSGGASGLDFTNTADFPNASGTPFEGTIGADYRLPGGVILGAAFSGGSQTQGFASGGHFVQSGEALSLFAGYRTVPVWGNAILGYDLLQNHIARQVALGIFTDQNNADADGHVLALALRGGYDLHLGPVTTGPVAGLVLQQVRIDGFTETGTSGLTALSFGSQTRAASVTQLGWRAAVEMGKWQPFADLAWNHDWANKNRTITAVLTSIAAPSWSSSAMPIASDWATASFGTAYQVNDQVILQAAARSVFVNPQVSSFGGVLSVNVAF